MNALIINPQNAFASDSDSDREAAKLQICFELQKSRALICHQADFELGLRYLSRHISAMPGHLSAHIRRIYFAIGKADSEQLLGALIDLFLVLQGKGRALVNRLIDQAAPLLERATLTALRKFADTSDFRCIQNLPLHCSVLVNGSLAISRQCFNPAGLENCA